jgi:enterobactin synthetase component D
MASFEQSYRTSYQHGILFGVDLPKDTVIPDRTWKQMHPTEQQFARTLHGKRKISYVGGRIAARLALQSIHKDHHAVERDPRGAPIINSNHSPLTISISHKADFAVALLNRQRHVTVGVDVEHLLPNRSSIADKVLTESEMAKLHSLPTDRQWGYLLIIFSFKEAIYKALAPKWKRYIGFDEAIVEPSTDLTAKVSLVPTESDILPLELTARYNWHQNSVITSVKARWQ